jgi:uncharacterized membrane protein YiaA
MEDISRDTGSPGRITRARVRESTDGEMIGDVEKIPRIVVVAAVVMVFVVGLTNFAFGQVRVGVAAVSVGLLVFGAGLSWLGMEGRRVRQAEREWLINHKARR